MPKAYSKETEHAWPYDEKGQREDVGRPWGRCPDCGSTTRKDHFFGGAYCSVCDQHLEPYEVVKED